MAKYRCYGVVSGTKYLGEVEAKDEKDAKEKAWELEEAHISLCYECSDECEDPEVTEISVAKNEDGE